MFTKCSQGINTDNKINTINTICTIYTEGNSPCGSGKKYKNCCGRNQ